MLEQIAAAEAEALRLGMSREVGELRELRNEIMPYAQAQCVRNYLDSGVRFTYYQEN